MITRIIGSRLAGGLAAGVLAVAAAAAPALAGDTATWVGTVQHIDSTQITVTHKETGKTSNVSKRFLIGDDFVGVYTSYGNKKKTLADVKDGASVQVTYFTKVIEHVNHAQKIVIMNGFNLNINLTQTPSPSP